MIRFFQDWGDNEALFQDWVRQNLRFLSRLGFKTLVMNGTSRKIGETKVHYLALSVLVGTVAIPIYWVQLEKIGASSQQERKMMFEAAFKLFNLKGMTLLADREYVGKDWFNLLKKDNIHLVIRLRIGDYFEETSVVPGKDCGRMMDKCKEKNKLVKKQIWLDGAAFWILMLPNPKIEAEQSVLLFFTTLPPTEKTAAQYVKCWKI